MTEGTKLARVMAYYGYLEGNVMSKQKIMCPFHSDVNPSMIVDLEQGSFHCFGCLERGQSAVDFIIKQEKVDMLDAYVIQSKILRNSKLRDIKDRVYEQRISNEEQLERAKLFYDTLPQPEWRSNKLDKDIMEVRDYMLERGFTKQLLNYAQARYTYSNNYPITFPVLDNKEFKGWQSRTINPEVAKKRKYLNNRGFSRASTIAGTYDKGAVIVLVEGYMDMLKFKQYGIRNVGALFGWAMTPEQLNKLKNKGITTIISALDNDECGRKGTKLLRKHFNVVRWRYLKGCKDPGEFTQTTFKRMLYKTKQKLKGETLI